MRTGIFYVAISINLFFFQLGAQDLKVEPPNWWVDMNREEIELLVYHPDIGRASVSTDSELRIIATTQVENPNYLFVLISTRGLKAGVYPIYFDLAVRGQMVYPFELKSRRPDSAVREGFNTSDVIYLIMPDRFANGNPENDNHPHLREKADRSKPGGRHGGDIGGILQNLEYLQDLGVTAIWCTPMCEDNDSVYSYHGYAQSNVYRIDPRFGSNEDYRQLSVALHQRGMKLIKDYVTNHWGLHHWIIVDLPEYDWINQHPGYAQSNYRMTTQFDPYASQMDKRLCDSGWFVKSMPDLNQKNPRLLNYLIQNAIWWIEYADLDGLRVDTYSYNDKEGIAIWTEAIMAEYPHFNIVGEVWMHQQAQIAYWQKDSPIGAIQGYNSHLPSVMDFTLHDAIVLAFLENKSTWDKGMIRIYENFAMDFLYSNPNQLLVFMENHDTDRINEVFQGDFNLYKMALTLILTTRGIPQLYYGSEIGMRGQKSKGDADIRRDFPGGWMEDPQNAFLKSERNEQQSQWFDFTQKLLHWRRSSTAVHRGKLLHFLPSENIYVYFRTSEDQKIMVILNNSLEEGKVDFSLYMEGIGQSTKFRDVISGSQGDISQNVIIPAKEVLILEWQD